MKQRVISALIGLAILAIVILNFNTLVLNIAVALIIIIAIDELLSASDCKKNRALYFTALCFGGAIPFLKIQILADKLPCVMFLFTLI
ncbi:MAG: hypothetical protein RRY40_02990, partial [Oscillospiraceae bacterium]